MSDEIKEIYLSSLDWTKTHDNMGGVMADCVFKNNMSYEEFEKLRDKTFFVLCDKDYITNLQEENERLNKELMNKFETQQIMRDATGREYELILTRRVNLGKMYEDYKSRCEKAQSKIDRAIEYIETHYLNANEPELLNILTGGDKE